MCGNSNLLYESISTNLEPLAWPSVYLIFCFSVLLTAPRAESQTPPSAVGPEVNQALIALEEGRCDDAVQLCRKAFLNEEMQTQGDDGGSAREEGLVKFWSKYNDDKFKEFYQEFVAMNPDPAAKILLAREHIQNDEREEALALLRQVARADAHGLDVSLRLALAQMFAQLEMWEDTAEQIRLVLKLIPPDTSSQVANLLNLDPFRTGSEEGRQQRIVAVYKELININPEPIIKLFLAQLYIQSDDHTSALELLMPLARADTPGIDATLRLVLAQAFVQLDKFDEAVDQVSRARDLLPDDVPEWVKLSLIMGKWLIKAGRTEDGIRHLEEYLDASTEGLRDPVPDVYFELGRAYRDLGEREQAENYFRRFLQVIEQGGFSPAADTLINLGDVYMKERKVQLAIEVYRRAVKVDPQLENIRLKLAQIYLVQGYPSKAISEVARITDDPELRPEVIAVLSSARVKLNDAQSDLERAEGALQKDKVLGQASDWTLVAFAIVLITGAGLLWVYLKSLQVERLVRRLRRVEVGLWRMIHSAVRNYWGSDWEEELIKGEYGARIGGKKLRSIAKEKNADDLLEVSTFGQLVGILDVGLQDGDDPLEFRKRCNPNTPQTRKLIVAALSQISSCRDMLVHSTMVKRELSGMVVEREERRVVSQMAKQIRRSLDLIREHFDMKLT